VVEVVVRVGVRDALMCDLVEEEKRFAPEHLTTVRRPRAGAIDAPRVAGLKFASGRLDD